MDEVQLLAEENTFFNTYLVVDGNPSSEVNSVVVVMLC